MTMGEEVDVSVWGPLGGPERVSRRVHVTMSVFSSV